MSIRRGWPILGVTAALLIPCFWQEHIQAGDLSSHLYNAWLAGEIQRGAVAGLAVVPLWMNVLSDWALEALLPRLGVVWTERAVVGAAVLVFFWGAFRLIHVAAGRPPWRLAPCLAMLTYGLVFHIGLLNFYLSTGFCLWILALLWRPGRQRVLLAAPLAVLALLAHVLPLAWAALALGYRWLVLRIAPDRRVAALAAGIAALALVRTAITLQFPYRWSLQEMTSLTGLIELTGAEQVWMFGAKYLIVVAGLVIVWVVLFLERTDQGGALADPVVHLWLLQVAATLLLPFEIALPQYQHPLTYITQRLSLLAALFLCVMVAGSPGRRALTWFSALVAALFFGFLYADDRAFSIAEKEITELVSALPPGQRVVAAITDSGARLNLLEHMIDRACIGRCYSYGNYEPPSAAFRIRVVGPNRIVASEAVVKELETGHTVTPEEAPVYAVCGCPDSGHRFCLRAVAAGERTCTLSLPVSVRLSE